MLGPVVGAIGAWVFGWFCVRLSGVYLAMLTLAFGQIVWSIVFQWDDVTGGSNGLVGVWPAEWLSDKRVYYLLVLAATVGGVLLLRRVLHAPFGLRDARGPRFAAAGRRDRHRRDAHAVARVHAGRCGLRPGRRAVRVLQGQHLAGGDRRGSLDRRAGDGAAGRRADAFRAPGGCVAVHLAAGHVARQTDYWRALLAW